MHVTPPSVPPSSGRLTLQPIHVQLRPVSRWRAGNLGVALWGVGGVLLLLGQALARLIPIALEPLQQGTLSAPQWVVLLSWVLVSAYSEGYRGFQKGFAPRVVGRAFELAASPRPLFVLLAPAYCMTYFAAPRARMITSWCVTSAIVGLVVAVRQLDQPWRGIIDGGVVVGLGWGVVAIVLEAARVYGIWSEQHPASH